MCGILAMIGSDDSAREVAEGLLFLQHRGQDGHGILGYQFEVNRFFVHKAPGLVGPALMEKRARIPSCLAAIGHTRYATTAKKIVTADDTRDLQPMFTSTPFGIGLAHNGNIVNDQSLRESLWKKDRQLFMSDNDAETLLHLVAKEVIEVWKKEGDRLLDNPGMLLPHIGNALAKKALGAYSLVSLIGGLGIVAMRDPYGIRPLLMGRRLSSQGIVYAWASESSVLQWFGFQAIQDVPHGELVLVDFQGRLFRHRVNHPQESHPCMFEWAYFSNPEAIWEGSPVYQARMRLGRFLGRQIKKTMEKEGWIPDVVVPVPETSRVAAVPLAEEIQVPYRELLVKNRYIQRSFILPDQKARQRALQLKLVPIAEEVRGKKILLVDDSIVRGTTSRYLVELLYELGASEVALSSTCPPIRHPCYFGIDFPLAEELVAHNKGIEEIAKSLGVTRLFYLDFHQLFEAIGRKQLCHGCLSGEYPFALGSARDRFAHERKIMGDKS